MNPADALKDRMNDHENLKMVAIATASSKWAFWLIIIIAGSINALYSLFVGKLFAYDQALLNGCIAGIGFYAYRSFSKRSLIGLTDQRLHLMRIPLSGWNEISWEALPVDQIRVGKLRSGLFFTQFVLQTMDGAEQNLSFPKTAVSGKMGENSRGALKIFEQLPKF